MSGRAAQRRQLAVLAILALARGRPVTRDRLIGLLWPETEAERARRQLSDVVYLLRRELGEEAIQASGDDVRLDGTRVATDLAAFEAALQAGDTAGAVALYAGPLLDGVFWDGAAEWERQVSVEREAVARAYASALEALAEQAAGQGDVVAAAAAWRRRAAHDPLDGRVCRRLMEALAAAGDRAGALQQARVHAALLREELDVGPDAGVEALAERLRQDAGGVADGTQAERTGGIRGEPPEPGAQAERQAEAQAELQAELQADRRGATIAGAGPAGAAARSQPRPSDSPPAAARPQLPLSDYAPAPAGAAASAEKPATSPAGARVRSWVPGLAVAVVLLVIASAVWLRARPAAGTTSPDRLVVLPFETLGSERVAYLGEGLVDLLSVTLDGAGSLRTVDPRAVLYQARQAGRAPLEPGPARALAARLGAGRYVRGTVSEAGQRLRITATLYGPDEAPIGSATVEGATEELFALVDRLSAELVALHTRTPGTRLEHLAARTTTSLPALRAYLDAEASFRRRAPQWEPEVVEAFGRAAELDSTFALAHYRLSVAAAWVGDAGLSQRAGERAARFADRLGRRERELLLAWQARLAGDVVGAEQRYHSLLDRYPDDVEAWWQLGELVMRVAPMRGDSVTAAADAYRRVLELDPTHGCARCSLIYIEMQRGNLAAADSLAAGFPPEQAGSVLGLRLVRAMERGSDSERRAVLRELDSAPVWTVHEAHFRARMWGRDPAAAAEIGRLVDQPRFPAEWRGLTRTLLVDDELGSGRPGAARALLRRTAEIETGWALVLEVLTALAPVAPVSAGERTRLLQRVQAWQPDTTSPSRGYFTASHNAIYPELRLYLLGVLHAASDDHRNAEAAAAALDAIGSGVARYLAAGVRGWLPPDDQALRHLDARVGMMPAEHVWLAPALGAPLERFRHAELLDGAGRNDEALRLLAAFGQNPWDIGYLAVAQLRMAEILERVGRTREAARHYARFAELWRDCEPSLRPQVEAALRKAAELGDR